MSAAKYDLVVIGSGPSGQRAAVAASKMKKRVAVVEVAVRRRRRLRQHRHHPVQNHARSRPAPLRLQLPLRLRHELPRQGKDHHGRSSLPRSGRDQNRSGRNRGPAFAQWHRHRPRHCPFCRSPPGARGGPHRRHHLEADRIIIAVGTKPAGSPRVPINGRTIINSDQVLDLPSLPKSLIVVGGGVIGVEYTCMFVDPRRARHAH